MDELTALPKALTAPPPGVRVPRYDRARLRAGWLHIGLGNFHRAHQAWWLHRLFDAGLDHDWAVIGAGVRPADAAQRDRLAAQDWLTTLIALDPAGRSAEICGAMVGFAEVAPDNGPLIAAMADPAIRIVSLTVTEGGYYRTAGDGFDADHPDIAHDAAHPAAPRTAFGAIVAALRARRAAGCGPFTGLSCDNLQGNGALLREAVSTLARLQEPALADWIEAHATFPNAMVDCIVPATGDAERALARDFGLADAAPVTHESFRQWVVEDAFCAGRPRLEEVGVTVSDRVADYEAMKLRILNGGHQIIAVPAQLLGVETIAEAMADPQIGALLRAVAAEEIVPHVAPVPEFTPPAYLSLIAERFANPAIRDTTRRVAFDAASRHAAFLAPTLRDALSAGARVDGLALTAAVWRRYCRGAAESGAPIPPNDPQATRLAAAAAGDAASFLSASGVYGFAADAAPFRDAFLAACTVIDAEGVRAALARRLAG